MVSERTELLSVIARTSATVGLGWIIMSSQGIGEKPNEIEVSTSKSTSSTTLLDRLVSTGVLRGGVEICDMSLL